ncbi:Transcriptional activator of acetoin dehydrogenase operon AcoR [Cupriavidus sp. U2]|uniref:sigma-54-dependent Fis family transcriptional regulator n=1 Tax=Cupriavidus sp. U2 TaxID=2920269 RepID=UPI00129E7D84|nr:sigma-54-dependent Fis family transcriptional regulator [Cupriavidus sp. U2]KAI3591256.1 Transcriptional activator of acetoin dehydrogenase operon AcoR [Cupriavidus sp. U2]
MDLRQREHIETVVHATTWLPLPAESAPPIGHDAMIQNSWRRCVHQYGLDPSRMQEARIVEPSCLREHQQRIDDFARIARHGLESLYGHVAGLGYVVLLTDAQGVTVDYIGDANTDAALRHAGLYLGSEWSEAGAGTCAVGTALVTGEALTVHQADHFDATHIPLTCTAAPLFDTQGRLNAILDISALTSPEAKASQGLALQMVRIYAAHIENANFLRVHHRDWILKLNVAPEFVDVSPEYLLALDAAGRIVGCNNRARRMLESESPGTPVLGQSFEALFDARIDDLGRFVYSRPSEQRLVALHRSGGLLYLSVMPPALRWQSRPDAQPVAALPAALAALSGGDTAMQQQLQRAARLVDARIHLLIHGETGSGKEYFAKALHQASARRAQPFVAFNCAAIPETLIESELFGHLPNSFSGAGARGKRGLIQEADGGTLFLDEIGDMPRDLQSRLLRVLAEGEVLPIGATRPVPVNVRVISATHHRLDQLVEAGQFREDLYYRLNGARFELPPLRERQDLDWLIDKMLADGDGGQPAAPGPRNPRTITLADTARQRLHAHRWPGNLRELRNVIEYACAICHGGVVTPDDLPDGFGASAPAGAALRSAEADATARAVPPEAAPEATPEAMLLMQYLRASGWNLSAVARQIGISRMTLYRRMERYGIASPNRRDGSQP